MHLECDRGANAGTIPIRRSMGKKGIYCMQGTAFSSCCILSIFSVFGDILSCCFVLRAIVGYRGSLGFGCLNCGEWVRRVDYRSRFLSSP